MEYLDKNAKVPRDSGELKMPMQSVCRGVSHGAALDKRQKNRKGDAGSRRGLSPRKEALPLGRN
jgi:hypothetical protein